MSKFFSQPSDELSTHTITLLFYKLCMFQIQIIGKKQQYYFLLFLLYLQKMISNYPVSWIRIIVTDIETHIDQ